jgi:transcriptional regulator with XRE-family HTH domain
MTTSQATIPRMGRRRKLVDQSTYSGRVAVRLRELRERAGKTVPEMAKSLRIPVTTYYNYENATANIPFDLIPPLCKVLGVSCRKFFPES